MCDSEVFHTSDSKVYFESSYFQVTKNTNYNDSGVFGIHPIVLTCRAELSCYIKTDLKRNENKRKQSLENNNELETITAA